MVEDMDFYRPNTISEAVELASDKEVTFFAGGTDLMVHYYEQLDDLGDIVDLTAIAELDGIRQENDLLHIGAGTTHQTIVNSDLLAADLPWLVQSAKEVGSPQIRNRGTIGGNIGNASPAADTVPALIVSDATIELVSVDQKREESLSDIFVSPGKTTIARDELITDIKIPVVSDNAAGSFQKIGKRNALAIAVINCAVFVKIDCEEDNFKEVRICLGSVAPVPYKAVAAENFLVGKEINLDNITEAAKIVQEQIDPIDDIRGTAEYRDDVAEVIVKRAICDALEQLEVEL
ncbi:MAG: FAD binding domain-containing protein [Bacillota bacterium]